MFVGHQIDPEIKHYWISNSAAVECLVGGQRWTHTKPASMNVLKSIRKWNSNASGGGISNVYNSTSMFVATINYSSLFILRSIRCSSGY